MGSLETEAFHLAQRLINVVRNPKGEGDLLSELLDGIPLNAANVTKLLVFARRHFDPIGDILSKIESVCTEYLTANNAPIPPRLPRAGEPGFHSVLEEFES